MRTFLLPLLLGVSLVTLALPSFATTVVIVAGADQYQGPPHFQLKIGTKVVGEADVTKDSGQAFTFDVAPPVQNLTITFTNDFAAPAQGRKPGEDRNLIIESIKVGGKVFSAKDLFPGTKPFAMRDTKLVMYTASTLNVPDVPAQPKCDASVDVTGFANGVVGLDHQQSDLLQPIIVAAKVGCLVKIVGYSSAVGTTAANKWSALARAQSVAAYLKKQGVQVKDEDVTGAGGTIQFGANAADNRRVVVTSKGSN
jgi:flagellar motor protein MotB